MRLFITFNSELLLRIHVSYEEEDTCVIWGGGYMCHRRRRIHAPLHHLKFPSCFCFCERAVLNYRAINATNSVRNDNWIQLWIQLSFRTVFACIYSTIVEHRAFTEAEQARWAQSFHRSRTKVMDRRVYPPPHMTHVSSSSYDTCILLLIWHMYPQKHNQLGS